MLILEVCLCRGGRIFGLSLISTNLVGEEEEEEGGGLIFLIIFNIIPFNTTFKSFIMNKTFINSSKRSNIKYINLIMLKVR